MLFLRPAPKKTHGRCPNYSLSSKTLATFHPGFERTPSLLHRCFLFDRIYTAPFAGRRASRSEFNFTSNAIAVIFEESTCHVHGKLIFEVAAIHLDAKASPGAISESVLAFFRWKKTQHRPGDCSRRGFATQIEAHSLENELPVYAARRFPKSTQVGL